MREIIGIGRRIGSEINGVATCSNRRTFSQMFWEGFSRNFFIDVDLNILTRHIHTEYTRLISQITDYI